jgi:hypothetical protein
MAGGATERAVLTARSPAGGELLLVSLDVDEAIAHRYTTPGQYIEVKADSGNGYFVLASNVGERPWQLLVKNAGGAADALATRPIGTQFSIVGPLGAGFSVERMRSRHVVVAVVGSAIGVARSVIGRRIADGARIRRRTARNAGDRRRSGRHARRHALPGCESHRSDLQRGRAGRTERRGPHECVSNAFRLLRRSCVG